MKRLPQMIPALLLPVAMACTPHDPGGSTIPPALPPGQNSLQFKHDGPTTTVAGSWGIGWQFETNPGVPGPVKWHLGGPGTLMAVNPDGTRSPVQDGSLQTNAFGYYVPPSSVPAGGITINLSFEAYSPITKRYELSQLFPIQVTQQTAPMTYISAGPTSASVHAGGSTSGLTSFIVQVNPRPLDFQQSVTLIPGAGAPADIGTAVFTNIDNSDWALDYTAPATVPASFDLMVQAAAHDPWLNQDRVLVFQVHVDP